MEKTKRAQARRLGFHRWVWNHLAWLIRLLARLKYGGDLVFEKAPPLKGAYLVLPNHASNFDQFFVAFSFPKRHMYFMVSEHIFRRKLLGKVMSLLAGPISRVKGGSDAAAVRAVLQRLRQGVPVCIFPEGERCWDGRTAPIHPATAKLIRMAGVPVVTYRLRGAYLADPRWSRSLRKGPIRGQVVNVYPAEEIRKLSPQALEALLARDLCEDAYAVQREAPAAYRGKALALGLEEALFLCPDCGGVGTLRGEGDVFRCACGLAARYDEYGFFDENAPFATVAAWSDWQGARLRAWAHEKEAYFADEGGQVWELLAGHKLRKAAEGPVRLDRAGLRVGEAVFPLAGMGRPSLCHFAGFETMMFSSGGKSYELRFPAQGGVSQGGISRRKYREMLLCLLDKETSAV